MLKAELYDCTLEQKVVAENVDIDFFMARHLIPPTDEIRNLIDKSIEVSGSFSYTNTFGTFTIWLSE